MDCQETIDVRIVTIPMQWIGRLRITLRYVLGGLEIRMVLKKINKKHILGILGSLLLMATVTMNSPIRRPIWALSALCLMVVSIMDKSWWNVFINAWLLVVNLVFIIFI